jgi:hypothetical protein
VLKDALKEWAVICRALAEGRQALILRKGGIAEAGGGFRLKHTRFWLFPSYTHQQRAGIEPEAVPLLDRAVAERPPPSVVRIDHFAEVVGVYHVHDLAAVLMLGDLHMWSEEVVQARFEYRSPGLYVLPVRVNRAAEAVDLPSLPYYGGCRSWVNLDRALPTAGATQVLTKEAVDDLLRTLDRVLNPTAFA